MAYGYNMGIEIAKLHDGHYDFSMGKCHEREDKIESLENEIATIQKLLIAIDAERQVNKKRVDLSDQPELVDEARKICSELLPEGIYEWQTEDQITILVEGLNSICAQITRKISPQMMYLTEELQRLPEIARIGAQTVSIIRDEIHRFVNNQRAGS
jgi:hypothetical protein